MLLDNSLELALCRIGRDDIIAPQSDMINERRIQRNIYQERQASEEIEAYKGKLYHYCFKSLGEFLIFKMLTELIMIIRFFYSGILR